MSEICQNFHEWCNYRKMHYFPFNKQEIPKNGIYILFENRETGHGAKRIVRIGTHTGNNQLRSRLSQHFEKENKDRSIFRKNIGRALLCKNKDPFIKYWDLDLTTKKARESYSDDLDFPKQEKTEKIVTDYIQDNFSFVVIQVENKEDRLNLESKIISTVSLCNECQPSKQWLGTFSPKEKIRKSGLWLVNELWKDPLTESDVAILERLGN